MMPFLVSAVIALAILAVFNLAITFGLVRRLRMWEQRQGAGALGPALPRTGSAVDELHLTLIDGHRIDGLGHDSDDMLIAVLTATCPACAATVRDLIRVRPPRLLTVLVGDQADAHAQSLVRSLDAVGDVAIVGDGDPILATLSAEAYPTLIVIGDGHVLAAARRLEDLPDRPPVEIIVGS